MQKQVIDPISAPAEWHRYLYRSILLPWETSFKNCYDFPRYSRSKPIAGVQLHKMETVHEVEQAWKDNIGKSEKQSSLTFFADRAALKVLLGLLRNCVAHGHYAQASKGRITFRHEHNGKLKLFGSLKFSELKNIVEFVTGGKG